MPRAIRITTVLVISATLSVAALRTAHAESPIITQMATTEIQNANAQAAVAAAKDPVTGAIPLESVPMQCAIECEKDSSLERTVCGGYLTATQLAARGLAPPAAYCNAKRQAKYAACMAACGFSVPALLRTVPERNDRSEPMPPGIGSPEEIARRPAGAR